MSKDGMLAEAVFDEELGKWTTIVEYDGEKIPVGSSEGEFFKICKWDSKEEAEEWIKSKFPQMILKSVHEKIEKLDDKPVCFISNELVYPLCIGKRNRFNEVFTTCQSCNLYEGMKEKN